MSDRASSTLTPIPSAHATMFLVSWTTSWASLRDLDSISIDSRARMMKL